MTNTNLSANKHKPRIIKGINTIGVMTLVNKEVGRFLNVYLQTIIAPVITTLLFYAIFALAFGGIAREVGGVPYMQFLAPGLVMMTMVQNSFSNTSSSIVISKVQGNIVDVLMPPLGPAEILTGYLSGGILRGLCVGVVTTLTMSFFVPVEMHSLFYIFAFAILGTMMLSMLGVVGGIWSEKFDHIAAVTNFFVTPLTFLSGTFYAIENLPPLWQNIAHYNPFFHMIDGFRYGFIGHESAAPFVGLCFLLVINVILGTLSYWMLRTGYKIKS
jgi:ABC-2 type transport system permease protein